MDVLLWFIGPLLDNFLRHLSWLKQFFRRLELEDFHLAKSLVSNLNSIYDPERCANILVAQMELFIVLFLALKYSTSYR